MATNKKEERGKKRQASKTVSTSKVKTRKTNSELKISKIQDLQLKAIGLTNHDNCDGKKIEKLLRQYRYLWYSVFMPSNQLYPLRDMAYGLRIHFIYSYEKEKNLNWSSWLKDSSMQMK